MKKMIAVCGLLLSGCGGDDEGRIDGVWEAEGCSADKYCSFTIERKTSAVGDWQLSFNQDDFGQLKHIGGEYYELNIDDKIRPMRFKNNKFYNRVGMEFKRVKEGKLNEEQ